MPEKKELERKRIISSISNIKDAIDGRSNPHPIVFAVLRALVPQILELGITFLGKKITERVKRRAITSTMNQLEALEKKNKR